MNASIILPFLNGILSMMPSNGALISAYDKFNLAASTSDFASSIFAFAASNNALALSNSVLETILFA
jgi:hypothetical protein